MELTKSTPSELVPLNQWDEIERVAVTFDLRKPQTDEEFDIALESLAQYMLFGTKFEPVVIKSRKAIKSLPTLNDIPLLCQGKECPYSRTCPVIKELTDNQIEDLKDKPCRDERFFSIELFCKLIKEMAVSPDNTVDLMTTASLVHYHLQKRRIMKRQQVDDLMVDEPGVIDQKSGNVYWKVAAHPLQAVLLAIEKQIEALHKQLLASRKDRLNAAATLGRGQNALEELLSGAAFRSSAQSMSSGRPLPTIVVENDEDEE